MKIIIGGAMGRMGRALAEACERESEQIVAGVDVAYQGQPAAYPIVTGYEQLTQTADVVVDFSRPEGLPELLEYCLKHRTPLVLCTTGFVDEEQRRIRDASQQIAILRSANMSLGVNVLRTLAAMATRALGDDYDVEIVERHHRMKLDSPSGTALMLYDAVKDERDGHAEPVYGRQGRTQRRESGEIGIHAVRGGTLTGEHEAGFYGNGEQLLLTHRAENRSLFAQGALRAAAFLQGKPAGLYTMSDLVDDVLRPLM